VAALGRKIIARKADVRDAAAIRQVVDEGVAEFGRLDIVVANAGIATVQAWDEVTPAVWQDTIDTNLTGVWHTMAATVPHLIGNDGGSIICISSTAGIKGLPFFVPYVAAKHGVVGLAKSMANELARHNIRVNTVHPTGVNTPMGPRPRRIAPTAGQGSEPRADLHEHAGCRPYRATRRQQRGAVPRLRRGPVRDRPRVHRRRRLHDPVTDSGA
jgi:NAD(P)-dependent dehydrogenase (short-subunit alcohol dehydrogenase family)